MISRIIYRLDNAYPSAEDKSAIEEYLATVDVRRAALEEIRPLATVVPEKVVAGLRARYPQFARMRTTGFDKIQRDLGMITNMTANAMLLGEHDTMDHEFTIWFQTIMKGVHVSPQFMLDGMLLWQDLIRNSISAGAWSLFRPHAEHVTEVLTSLPVPARDEIGERKAIVASV